MTSLLPLRNGHPVGASFSITRTLVLVGLLLLTAYFTVSGGSLSASAATATADTPASTGQAPIELGNGRVADLAGVLSSEQVSEIEAASHKLSEDEFFDVWIVLVDRFADPEDAQQWADAVATKNGLGAQQYLLAIATEGRTFFLSAPSLGRVPEARLLEIERRLIAPKLTVGDFTGAALATFSGLSEPLPKPTATAVAAAKPITPGTAIAAVILVTLPFLLIALLVWILVRRRRASRALRSARAASMIAATVPAPTPAPAPAPAPAPIRLPVSVPAPAAPAPPPGLRPINELGREADSALVATDDAVRMAEQDLGFAAAQYGDSSVGDFSESLARAKQHLAEAFALKQKLTDEIPDTEQEIREWTTRIIALCAASMANVEAQRQRFAALRHIEADAGALLISVREEVSRAEAGIPVARADLDRLRARYGGSVLTSTEDNLTRAEALITATRTELESAESGLVRGDSSAAALAIQRAQSMTAQATTLASTISARGGELAEAASRVLSQSTILEQLITIARGISENVNVLTPLANLAEQTVSLARGDTNPLRALDKLHEASAALTHAIEDVQRSRAEASAGFVAAPAGPTTPEDAKRHAREAKDLARAQKSEARRARIARENVARAERDQIREIERVRELEREQARQRRAERTESRRPRDSAGGSSSGGSSSGGRGRSSGGGGRF
ncbi:putative membrane protein YgcG [Mycetocola sp. BIGb0189]|uniref:TPM domain-containing protein n=1 Tax=Mycetocola sp. BIGb0189 TaxID=2940604 RepID=UPI002167E50B|nr:TPM domain-containing protein [Mycetocola sp. BIGb0189]MCS4274871.1 putative membrane protein YgcG [Mycetocola sp. BIGb0189]